MQRDLKFLSLDNDHWDHIAERVWINSTDNSIRLHWNDSLRLELQLNKSGRIWIQVPRMYPHRPPVVSRIEGLWMERIVVHEAAPDAKNADMAPTVRCGNTVVFPHWSPVMNLGTLLEFCIETANSYQAITTTTPTTIPTMVQETNHSQQQQHDEQTMDVSHPFKFTSVFPPNRFDVGFEKPYCQHQSSMEL